MQTLVDLWISRYRRNGSERRASTELAPMTVVTGASGGIGRALAVEFARLGNPLLLVARSGDALTETARLVAADGHASAYVLEADLSTPEGMDLIDRALSDHQSYCDVLINNAGIGLAGPFAEQDEERLAGLVELNVATLTALTRRHLPGMLARGRGGILNVASLASYLPGPYQAAYYASKAYVLSLTEAIAAENKGQGVRICALTPGPVDTGFHAASRGDRAPYSAFAALVGPAYVARRALSGYRWGWTVIAPGLAFRLLGFLARVSPHPMVLPWLGWLLRPDRHFRPPL